MSDTRGHLRKLFAERAERFAELDLDIVTAEYWSQTIPPRRYRERQRRGADVRVPEAPSQCRCLTKQCKKVRDNPRKSCARSARYRPGRYARSQKPRCQLPMHAQDSRHVLQNFETGRNYVTSIGTGRCCADRPVRTGAWSEQTQTVTPFACPGPSIMHEFICQHARIRLLVKHALGYNPILRKSTSPPQLAS